MGIITTLLVDDESFRVLNYHIQFKQPVDYTGRPQATPQGGLVSLVLEATRSDVFESWATSPNMMKQVKLEQSSVFFNSRTRILELYDVHCIKQHTNFNNVGENPVTTHVVLSPAIIAANGVKLLEKSWKISDLAPVTPETREDELPLILDSAHFEDEQGNIIDEKYNGIATLVIKTQNGDGKTIDIDLSSRNHDFKYDNNILEEDILTNVRLTGDTTRVRLEIIEEQNQ